MAAQFPRQQNQDPIGYTTQTVWNVLNQKTISLEWARFLTQHGVPLDADQFKQFSLEWIPGLDQLSRRPDGDEIWRRERMPIWREIFLPAWSWFCQRYATQEAAFKPLYAKCLGVGSESWTWPREENIVKPLLENGAFTIVYGEVGTGKTDIVFTLQKLIRQTFLRRNEIGDAAWPFTVGKPIAEAEPILDAEDALGMNNLGWRKARAINLFTSVRFDPRVPEMGAWTYTPELSGMCCGEWRAAMRGEMSYSFMDEMGVNTSKFRQMDIRALTINGLHRMRRKANVSRFVASQYRGAGDIQDEVERGATLVIEKYERDRASFQYRGLTVPKVFRDIPSFGDDKFLTQDSSAIKVDFDIMALVDYQADELARRSRKRKEGEGWDPNESYEVMIEFVEKTKMDDEEIYQTFLESQQAASLVFKGRMNPRTKQPWYQRDVADLLRIEVKLVREAWSMNPGERAGLQRKVANRVRDIAGVEEEHGPVIPNNASPLDGPNDGPNQGRVEPAE